MRVVAASVFLGALLAGAGALAGESSCNVDNRLGLRVIRCDEDPVVTSAAMARAQAACAELPAEDQADCTDAIAQAFALRRESMIRRGLRAGWGTDAIASRYGASAAEIAKVEADMAPRARSVDPEAQARAAEERLAAEREIEEWRLLEGLR